LLLSAKIALLRQGDSSSYQLRGHKSDKPGEKAVTADRKMLGVVTAERKTDPKRVGYNPALHIFAMAVG